MHKLHELYAKLSINFAQIGRKVLFLRNINVILLDLAIMEKNIPMKNKGQFLKRLKVLQNKSKYDLEILTKRYGFYTLLTHYFTLQIIQIL